jgi:hypothetical protein
MIPKSRITALTTLLPLLVSSWLTASAQDLDEAGAERCINIHRIRNTEVVDDSNILFYERGDRVYLNRLPHRCPGLRVNRTFMYRTSMSQLCDLDIITVLYDQGFGFMPGASCGLGRFYPITMLEADAMLEQRSGKTPDAKPVPPAKPEEVSEPR